MQTGPKMGAEPQLPTVTIAEERSTVIANVYFSRTLRGTTSISPSHANWTKDGRRAPASHRYDCGREIDGNRQRIFLSHVARNHFHFAVTCKLDLLCPCTCAQ